jgi:RNA polymerase sigma factor (sigma-70 family)
MRIVSDKVIVEDCIQDLFIRLWRRKELIGVPLSIPAYLFQSLRRCVYRSIEKQRKTGHATLDESYAYESQSSHEMSMIDSHAREEQLVILDGALQSIPSRQREVIYLKFYSKMTYQEISGIMGLSLESVYNLVSRAIRTLQDKLEAQAHLLLLPGFS